MEGPAAGTGGTRHERRLVAGALLVGLPATLVALGAIAAASGGAPLRIVLAILLVAWWVGCAMVLRRSAVRPLLTASSLLTALRQEDYSVRARGALPDDAIGELLLEANLLAEQLRQRKLDALEATALLRAVLSEVEVAIFAFDEDRRLRLVNRMGERLLGDRAEHLAGRGAGELGLDEALDGPRESIVEQSFPGASGRWSVRRSTVRARGLPHQLIVLANISTALREEERSAWQRLIRVLGHEMNNSMTPIRSIAGSLRARLAKGPLDAEAEADLRDGLTIIAERSAELGRFMQGYAQLARLPSPRFAPFEAGACVRAAAALETRVPVAVRDGAEVIVSGDRDQLQQLLINLIRNAADAALETGGGVRAEWRGSRGQLEIVVDDDGPGLANPGNAFVPFFTTKPGGSGIGLALARQIAEAHGGSVTLENRVPGPGCRAVLRLPL